MGEIVEKYVQIPLPEEYIERLERRAAENDRVLSREGANIIKAVLDGRYVSVVASMPAEDVAPVVQPEPDPAEVCNDN